MADTFAIKDERLIASACNYQMRIDVGNDSLATP